MRIMRRSTGIAALGLILVAPSAQAQVNNGPTVSAVLRTAPLYNYEEAPATPDADDPAVWVNKQNPGRSLVIGTAKDAGLVVYDLEGKLLQAIRPPNAPRVSPLDPPTPAGPNPAPDKPCADSASGDTFGRYNNVDIAYNLRVGAGRADVAVVSDRGCDRLRFFLIDRQNASGPLIDVTAADVPRVFPIRYDQPSAAQPTGGMEGWRDNPVDDQNTVYGLTVTQADGDEVFVSQRERGLVRQLQIVPARNGRLTYRSKRLFLFDTSFELPGAGGHYAWTPCREAALEEPQAEGLEFDEVNGTLYVAFETIGLYRLRMRESRPSFVAVGLDSLIEPLTSFGRAYHATPDDDEFECTYDPSGAPGPDDVVAAGSALHAGKFLAADLEGLSIAAALPGQALMLVSSQGDSSFHFYRIGRRADHVAQFFVEGVGDTDGVHWVGTPMGRRFPVGLLLVQNGEALEPEDTGEVNGYEFDGSTQFEYISILDVLKALTGSAPR